MAHAHVRTAVAVGSEALRTNLLRTTLSTLGVIIGVASLVAVLSLGDGMEQSMRTQLSATTPVQAIGISALSTETIDGERFPLKDTAVLTDADLNALVTLPLVSRWTQAIQVRQEVRRGSTDLRRMVNISGVRGTVEPGKLLSGRALAATDSGQRVTVLGSTLAKRLTSNGDSVELNTALVAGADTFRIVGVMDDGGNPMSTMLVPWDVGLALAARRGLPVPTLQLQTARVEDVAATLEGVGRVFSARSADWQKRFSVESYQTRARQAAQGILIFKLLMGAITGISLLVGGIGIMNVLLASVSERTREIGIRRATGATRRDILYQFLAEAVTISGLGAVIGIVLGLVGAFGITAAIRHFASAAFVQASFSWTSVFAAALAAVLVGLAFGTWPARRAAALAPIDAIRHE